MKTSKRNFMMPMAMVILAVGFIACGKKKSDDSSSVSAGRDESRTQSTSLSVPAGAAGTLGTQAAVTANDAAKFQSVAQLLASAGVDPESIGSISNRDGVVLRGAVGIDKGNGQIITSNSVIEIDINDSNVGKKDVDGHEIPPIKIVLQGVSGGVQSGNKVQLVFGDNLGTVTLTGHYDQTNFTGTLSFVNKSNTINGQHEGTLGDFQVPVCGFFRCN